MTMKKINSLLMFFLLIATGLVFTQCEKIE